MRAKTAARIDRLQNQIGIGCALCKDRPSVHLLGEGDPLPERCCPECGRRFDDEVHVILGVDPSVI